jgi:hypothetical protein
LADFKKISKKDKFKKLLIFGPKQTGKSSLLNLLANVDLVSGQINDSSDDEASSSPKFPVGNSDHSVSFLLAHITGKSKKDKVMFIDTPGSLGTRDIPQESLSSDSDEEFQNKFSPVIEKIKKLGKIHMVLFLLPLDEKTSEETLNMIQGVSHMFKDAGGNIFDHLVFAYSKCDDDSSSDYEDLKNETDNSWNQLKKQISEMGESFSTQLKNPLLFLTSKRRKKNKLGQKKEVKKLVKMLNKSETISTKKMVNPGNFFKGKNF